jgi:DNA-binding NarL/FixJ family response regulator
MRRPRLLVVDDHDMLRQALAELLVQAGFDVVGEAATAPTRSRWPSGCTPTWS